MILNYILNYWYFLKVLIHLGKLKFHIKRYQISKNLKVIFESFEFFNLEISLGASFYILIVKPK